VEERREPAEFGGCGGSSPVARKAAESSASSPAVGVYLTDEDSTPVGEASAGLAQFLG
jgi:hypothetical protein